MRKAERDLLDGLRYSVRKLRLQRIAELEQQLGRYPTHHERYLYGLEETPRPIMPKKTPKIRKDPYAELKEIDAALDDDDCLTSRERSKLEARRKIVWKRVYDPSPRERVVGIKSGRLSRHEEDQVKLIVDIP